ncbi:helix-turn-helix domain-containing protein [Actinomadura madurae]|uniref:helix-turn-helix domain-containing protein n=1 Tax=Actinomadura madurae TaxID=1993 RepID=UPI0020D22073|nr:helix-turn-helix domain-containing protein [Actinomadura madurae]MCP9979587.1 helix-turn-helix domain-containing protein [Actinomadura madurae]
MTSDSAGLEAAAILSDDLRRGMYAFIRAAQAPVTRDEAAASVGISRKLAAFHLDKLVDAGLLRARYGSPGVRRVGRAPKVYEPSGLDVRVSIPQREHGLLASILLDAVRGQAEGRAAGTRRCGPRGSAGARSVRRRAVPSGAGGSVRSVRSRARRRFWNGTGSSPSGRGRPGCGCATARSTRWPGTIPIWCAGSTTRSWRAWWTASARPPSRPCSPPTPAAAAWSS